MRAVQVFGFHLATVDLRQSSDQHEAVMAELLAAARIEADYAALDEDAKRALLLRAAAATRGRCACAAPAYSEAHASEARRSSRRRAQAARALRPPRRIRHYIISHTESVSDLLEVLLLQKEAGLMRGTLATAHAPSST